MSKKLAALAVVIATATLAPTASAQQLPEPAIGPAPSWVRPLTSETSAPASSAPADAPIVLTRFDQQVRLLPDGGTTLTGDTVRMEATTQSLRPEISYADAQASVAPLAALADTSAFISAPGSLHDAGRQAAVPGDAPTTAAESVSRGNSLLDEGSYGQAVADFDRAIALDSDNALAYADRGVARARLNQTTAALDDLDRAAALNPRLNIIFHGRATILGQLGDLGGALAALNRAIELDADDRWAHTQRIVYALARENYTLASTDVAAVIRLAPNEPSSYAAKARVETAQHHYDAALLAINQALQMSPDDVGLQVRRGAILARNGRADEARAIFARLRTAAAGDADKLNDLCWEQAQANFDLTTAASDCEAALRVSPQRADIIDSAAFVELRGGHYAEAIARYNQALQLVPTQAASLYGRGIAKRRAGQVAAGDIDIDAARARDALVAYQYAEQGVTP